MRHLGAVESQARLHRRLNDLGRVELAAGQLLASTGDDPTREGLQDTPARFAKAWEELTAGYHQDPAQLFRHFDAEGYDEMVHVGPVPFHSLCEHHLLPFHGDAHLVYIANGRIVGLSKLARLVREVYAPRLQVQERLTNQLADALVEHLDPAGVAVLVKARHLCMEMRGVRTGAFTTTSALRGKCRSDPAARAEALALVRGA